MAPFFFATGVAACGGDRPIEMDAGFAGDAAAAADAADASERQRDAATADASLTDAESGFVRVQTAAGPVTGELLHTYDHRQWWSPAEAKTLAIFDSRAFAPFPEDRSVSLIRTASVSQVESAVPEQGQQTYRSFVTERGLDLERLPLDAAAFIITGHDSYHLEENGFGDFAWDFVFLGADGRTHIGAGAANDDFLIWGAPVYAPVSGTVVEVVADGVDNVPGAPLDLDATNNLIGIHVGGAFYVYLLHFQQGGVDPAIAVGAVVNAGDFLGFVGNSGVSLAPHLHVTTLWYDAQAEFVRSWSLPNSFRTLEVLRAGGSWGSVSDHVPTTGETVRNPN